MKIICVFDFVLGAINFFAWMVSESDFSMLAAIICTAMGFLALAAYRMGV